jgi:hypothetical protein
MAVDQVIVPILSSEAVDQVIVPILRSDLQGACDAPDDITLIHNPTPSLLPVSRCDGRV